MQPEQKEDLSRSQRYEKREQIKHLLGEEQSIKTFRQDGSPDGDPETYLSFATQDEYESVKAAGTLDQHVFLPLTRNRTTQLENEKQEQIKNAITVTEVETRIEATTSELSERNADQIASSTDQTKLIKLKKLKKKQKLSKIPRTENYTKKLRSEDYTKKLRSKQK